MPSQSGPDCGWTRSGHALRPEAAAGSRMGSARSQETRVGKGSFGVHGRNGKRDLELASWIGA